MLHKKRVRHETNVSAQLLLGPILPQSYLKKLMKKTRVTLNIIKRRLRGTRKLKRKIQLYSTEPARRAKEVGNWSLELVVLVVVKTRGGDIGSWSTVFSGERFVLSAHINPVASPMFILRLQYLGLLNNDRQNEPSLVHTKKNSWKIKILDTKCFSLFNVR